jgi:hypothetical protein
MAAIAERESWKVRSVAAIAERESWKVRSVAAIAERESWKVRSVAAIAHREMQSSQCRAGADGEALRLGRSPIPILFCPESLNFKCSHEIMQTSIGWVAVKRQVGWGESAFFWCDVPKVAITHKDI